ncbi:MAG: electron transfer flavoprotein subunit alpha/FixB family protein [Myxococcota bacterium]|nr:electron transfer flavoprotein subunit alpha/FixB family protein [Myxococcota bacterium]
MAGILVFSEHEGGQIKKTAFELIAKAASLGMGPVSAVVVGDVDTAALGTYGATTVYKVAGDFSSYTTGAYAKALAAVIEKADPAVVLGAASAVGKDLFPRVGARIGAGVVTEATDLIAQDGGLVAHRPIYAGKAFVTAKVNGRALITVRPNSFGAPEAGAGSAEVVAVDAGISAADSKVQVVESIKSTATVADLTEADRIVSAGRSIKSAEQYDAVVRPLAATIGATPGASRAAVDAGYAPHSHQVGQTGKVVNPNLYIALGISGAIQHLAGMRTSKVIVAVNKDPEAPIFAHATYGLVDDLFEVAPALQAKLASL